MTPYRATRRVEFHDTDMAGMMHFSAFITYMESAEHEMLRTLGHEVFQEHAGETISFPRVHVECDYRRPLKFGQQFDVLVTIDRIGDKSIRYAFEFLCEGQSVAQGKITAACCRFSNAHPPAPVSIPAEIRAALEQGPGN